MPQILDHGVARSAYTSIKSPWRRYLQETVFVPSAAEHYLEALKRGGIADLLPELNRLAALGNPWASAWLGYYALRTANDGHPDTDRAINLCRGPAVQGFAYAQYILAWALLIRGDRLEGAKFMKCAAGQKFPPALLDFVTLFWRGWGVQSTQDRRILKMLRLARAVGHQAEWMWRFAIYRSGKLGETRRILGYVLLPLGNLRYAIAKWRSPFSAAVFIFEPALYLLTLDQGAPEPATKSAHKV